MAATLTGYKLFRHTSDISAQDHAWCVANTTLAYSGMALLFTDTGLLADKTYYYKLFALYDVAGVTFYSDGVSASATTMPGSIPGYQPWENYPDSPVLTEDYPYQVVFRNEAGGSAWLIASPVKLYRVSGSGWQGFRADGLVNFKAYLPSGSTWVFNNNYNLVDFVEIFEANEDIYTNSTLTTVYFAKTTA